MRLVAFRKRLKVSKSEEVILNCAEGSDVIFALKCEEASICYVEALKFSENRSVDRTNLLDGWGVDRSPKKKKVRKYIPGVMKLYDESFSVSFM